MSDSRTTLTDADREGVIDTLAMLARGSATPAQRRYWFNLVRDQIAARSPEQVEKMEQKMFGGGK